MASAKPPIPPPIIPMCVVGFTVGFHCFLVLSLVVGGWKGSMPLPPHFLQGFIGGGDGDGGVSFEPPFFDGIVSSRDDDGCCCCRFVLLCFF